MAVNNVLIDKDDNILNFKIPRYENLKNYSTTEEIVGKWIDDKTLYRKVVDFGAFPNNGQKVVSTNITNLDLICWFEYSWFDTDDNKFFSGMRFDNASTYCKISVSASELFVEGRGINWSTRTSDGKCIIYYTKTTD